MISRRYLWITVFGVRVDIDTNPACVAKRTSDLEPPILLFSYTIPVFGARTNANRLLCDSSIFLSILNNLKWGNLPCS